METVIKVEKNELNTALLEKLKSFVEGLKHPVITIKISDTDNKKYFETLEDSVGEFERGEVISFTMEEFTKYVKSTK